MLDEEFDEGGCCCCLVMDDEDTDTGEAELGELPYEGTWLSTDCPADPGCCCWDDTPDGGGGGGPRWYECGGWTKRSDGGTGTTGGTVMFITVMFCKPLGSLPCCLNK